MSEDEIKLTEDTWEEADKIYKIVYGRLREIADTFIEIFEIDLGNHIYYKVDRVSLIITFWERGFMGDPDEEETVYRDEDGYWCSDIGLTKKKVLNPEQWYSKMRKLKAEQDKVRDERIKVKKLRNEELRKKQYEELKKEFEGD